MNAVFAVEIALVVVAVALVWLAHIEASSARRAARESKIEANRASRALIDVECARSDIYAHCRSLANMLADAGGPPTQPGGDTVPDALRPVTLVDIDTDGPRWERTIDTGERRRRTDLGELDAGVRQ